MDSDCPQARPRGLVVPFASDADRGHSTGHARASCGDASAILREDPLRTFTPKPADINRAWHVIDAEGQVLGKVATEVATLLRGKHKPIWAPHVDTGDHVIVVNAAKLDISARKLADKQYHRHSGYPGGLTTESLEHLIARDPERVVRLAVRGMLPKNRLGRAMIRKLRVYAGPTHPHIAQQPQPASLASKRSQLEEVVEVPKPLIQSTGRRKEAVARVRLRPGSGVITVNGRPFEQYFPILTHRVVALEPLRLTQTADVYDVDATLDGGGVSGQAGALRLGIRSARALVVARRGSPARSLKKSRPPPATPFVKERRKYGLKKARKAPQYSKR